MSYALLFDIGNVIVSFDFQISIRRIESFCSVPANEIFEKLHPMKDDLESGVISSDEFLDRATRMAGYTGTRKHLIDSFQRIFELNEPMVSVIEEEAEKGIPLFLLSNTNGIHVPYLFAEYPVFERFSGAIFSHEAGCLKPSPEIYEIAIAELKLAPERTIYIDDLRENCEAGARSGLKAIPYDRGDHGSFLEIFRGMKESMPESSGG